MTFNYLSNFPIPEQVMPSRLQSLLRPVDLIPNHSVDVACRLEFDPHGNDREILQLLMAVVPGEDGGPIGVLSETCDGVVESSTPADDTYGSSSSFRPSISGYDYIVAAWGGGGSFFTYNLAEKVWMLLGLTPRCEGNEQQRMVYDDLSGPVFNVAEGEISSSYEWNLKRNVTWRMSNEHLRNYLWLRGARGVRVFFYEALVADTPELRALMDGKSLNHLTPSAGVAWYELTIREHKERLLIQVWASVETVTPEQCPKQTSEGLVWPGTAKPMTYKEANDILLHHEPVYLDDRFLQKYEQNAYYNSAPYHSGSFWYCDPAYRGQWSFTECRRVGRNLIRVPMRELYKPKPELEILHAHKFALEPAVVASFDLNEEHIVAKAQRLMDIIIRLGNGLASLGKVAGLDIPAKDWVGIDYHKVKAEGMSFYPAFCRLAQVTPLNMEQHAFLARCKTISEIISSIPDGNLKSLLERAGCKKATLKERKTFKLLEALMNVTSGLNERHEKPDAFVSEGEPEEWDRRNHNMAPLFHNNDLRIADAHENPQECSAILIKMGFDTAGLKDGYGRALDFVMDRVTATINDIVVQIETLLEKGTAVPKQLKQ